MRGKWLALLLAAILLVSVFTACNGGTVVYIPHPVLVNDPVATYQFGIAFQRGNGTLRDQVWAALQVLSADGTVGQIARRWFGEDPTIIPPNPDATAAFDEVRDRTLIIGFDASSAPMSFFDESNQLVGFDIDLARAVCAYYGWTLELLPIQWAEREMELASGNVDALWGGVTLTDNIRQRLYHTPAYMENPQVVVALSNARIRNLRGMRGRSLAYSSGTVAELALLHNSSFSGRLSAHEPYDTLTLALEALGYGEVDGVLMDLRAADYFVRTGDGMAFGGRLGD